MPRPFRFGILTKSVPSRDAWLALARRAEALGYSTFQVDDHIYRELGPIAALAAAAAVTSTIRISCVVFANDFRNPVVFAKEAASLDILSDGRLELGLGTGYWREDYDRTGIPFDSPGTRVARFVEAVQIIKAFFAGDPVEFSGRHYAVRGLEPLPRPIQRPHPPLLIGGGSRRMLELAAREADIVGVNVRTTPEGGFDFASISPAATDQKIGWLREAAGSRLADLELHMMVPFVAVTDEPRRAAEAFIADWGIAGEIDANALLASPHALIGSEDQIVELLQERRERHGVSYLTVFQPALERFAPVVARLAGR